MVYIIKNIHMIYNTIYIIMNFSLYLIKALTFAVSSSVHTVTFLADLNAGISSLIIFKKYSWDYCCLPVCIKQASPIVGMEILGRSSNFECRNVIKVT